jgi:hypothetical protein
MLARGRTPGDTGAATGGTLAATPAATPIGMHYPSLSRAHIFLGGGIPGFGRTPVVLHCRCRVLGGAASIRVAQPEIQQNAGARGIGRAPVLLQDAVVVVVANPQFEPGATVLFTSPRP